MRKIPNEEIITEIKRVHKSNSNKIPNTIEWKQLSIMTTDVLRRAFGSYKAAWESAGFEYDVGSNYRKKEEIMIDLQRAFFENKQTTVDDLIGRSGHNYGTILKYFGSADNALKTAKIDLSAVIRDEQIMEEFQRICSEIGEMPTEVDIARLSKYSPNTMIRRFGSLMLLADKCSIIPALKLRATKEELLTELKRVCGMIGRTPTILDLEEHSMFSHNVYSRSFGSFEAALCLVGYTTTKRLKIIQSCPVCGKSTVSMISHMSKEHPQEYIEQEHHLVELFKSGLSARKIAIRDDTIFNGATSINRVINKYLTKDEIESFRRAKIKSKLTGDYADGKYDWIKHANRDRNTTPEARQKNSDGLKHAYESGERVAWNKGQTKETNPSIAKGAVKISENMKVLYSVGQLEKKLGPVAANWNEDREEIGRRYRLGLDFSSEHRRLIKERSGYRCEVCFATQEQLEEHGDTLHCDHKIPICLGGLDDWDTNGQALCPKCHRIKTCQELELLRQK